MTLKHHLDDATLVRYASGDLDEAFSVIVASHLAMCETCRNAVRAAEAIGGDLLEKQDQADLGAGAFERLMQTLDDKQESIAVKKAEQPVADAEIPAPLSRLIGVRLDAIVWAPIAPGIAKHDVALSSDGKSSLFMLKIAPGKSVPEHGHNGHEMTLVLSGAYRDEMGRFERGDISDLDEHVEHQPRVEPGEPCICLVAIQSPTRFKGLLGRLMQPFLRI